MDLWSDRKKVTFLARAVILFETIFFYGNPGQRNLPKISGIFFTLNSSMS